MEEYGIGPRISNPPSIIDSSLQSSIIIRDDLSHMLDIKLKPFEETHIEDAAQLFAERYSIEKQYPNILPQRYKNHQTVVSFINDRIKKAHGVIAYENGKLCGYLIEQLLPSWRGRRSIFVPF